MRERNSRIQGGIFWVSAKATRQPGMQRPLREGFSEFWAQYFCRLEIWNVPQPSALAQALNHRLK
jgi:hypothetical protein